MTFLDFLKYKGLWIENLYMEVYLVNHKIYKLYSVFVIFCLNLG